MTSSHKYGPCPSLNSDTSVGPGFPETWEALCTLGKVFMNILLPYVCVKLSLSKQLTLLSTMAHMLLAMAHEDKAGTKLMPSQLYMYQSHDYDQECLFLCC